MPASLSAEQTTLRISKETARFCYLDFDLDHCRAKHALVAAFVNATDSRYGFSSKDLRLLGGSELQRIPDLMQNDHEWSSRSTSHGGMQVRPLVHGSRILLKLYWDVAPLACENFATLCCNGSSINKASKPCPVGESGKPLTYRDSVVHRVVPGFVVQGGDILFGNGSGGESVFGKKFKDERAGLGVKHDRRGILSMGNSGKNSNTSQWFLTLSAAPQCDSKHVVFGEMMSGWQVLDAIEKYGTANGDPTVQIAVTDCGVWAPFVVPGAGYWFDKPDAEAYSGVSPVFMVRPRVALLVPSAAVFEKFAKFLIGQDGRCSVTPVISEEYDNEAAPIQARLRELLTDFAVDLVLVVPACKDLVEAFTLPDSWNNNNDTNSCNISVDTVVLEAKPVDAIATIHSKSWLAAKTNWHMEGMS